ncbi:hypothetical protein J8F10_28825 [Gemmata sp. G18]|uniref:Response regulatory domain-containing protein n=1 Tax=Gemmata palustris TaxID=2822762 RepID=A0ABS5C036_9BACT|nr:hypothetical protein [Gemmata palustris]MBP3959268.1 hypothetical protein [Gemmata palustris]
MTASDPGDRGRQWLTRLFAGDAIPAIAPIALPPADRTAVEHAAVARAAGCCDLFVIHADPAAGERVIADIARAAPDRVLVLSPNPGAADRVTERLLKCGVPVLRALADDENPTRPSPAVSKVTSVALGSARAEQARREAAAEVTAAESRIAAFASVSKALARLAEVNESLARLGADLVERTAARDRIESDLRAETDTPFALALAKLQADHDEATTKLAAELQAATAAHTEKEAALTQARHILAEAVRKPGFLSRLFSGKTKPGTVDLADLEKQVHAHETEVAALADQVRDLQAKSDASRATTATECAALVASELSSRRTASDAAITTTEDERARAQAEATALNKVITAAVPGEDCATAEQKLTAAREKAAEIARSAPQIGARAIVGTPGSLSADPVFSAFADKPPFGVLVLDRAEELPEAEFPRLARLAERWVLVGHALPPDDPRPQFNNARSRGPRSGRAEVPFAARLAKALDRETWTVEGERLVCRLTHLTPDQRRSMTREPLADRPEIELRFTATGADPLLAEIAFPGHTAVPVAKSFLFHELGEVLLRPCGELCWTHGADAITAGWSAADVGPDAAWVDLEAGVREKVTGAGPFTFTAAVSFDPTAGWDADRAAAWLATHLPPPSPSRFAALPRTPGARPGA